MGANTGTSLARFPMPQNLEPEMFSLCVLLPRDDEYLQILGQQINQLTNWNAWDYDGVPGHRGLVQAVWKAVQSAFPESVECADMSCLQFRNQPDNPCQIQVSCDDGATWASAWRMDLCQQSKPLYRYDEIWNLLVSYDNGVSYQINNNLDLRFNAPVLAPQLGDNAACIAAENIRDQFIALRTKLHDAFVAGADLAALSLIISGVLIIFGTAGAALPLVSAILGLLLQLDASLIDSIMSDENITAIKCQIFCTLNSNEPGHKGEFNQSNYDYLENWVTANFASDTALFWQMLLGLAGTVGLQDAAAIGGNSGLSCDACDCPECVVNMVVVGGSAELHYLGDCQYYFVLPADSEVTLERDDGTQFKVTAYSWTNISWTAQYKLTSGGTYLGNDWLAFNVYGLRAIGGGAHVDVGITFTVSEPV